MLLPSISNTICKCLTKKTNFVNIDKPCREKAKHCEKTFSNYVGIYNKFFNEKTNNECHIFHKKVT